MKISVRNGKYRSIHAPLEWDDVPQFSILTGENGGGKSNLLLAIKQHFAPDKNLSKEFQDGKFHLKIDGFSCAPSQVIYTSNLADQIDGESVSLHSITNFLQEIKSNRQQQRDSFEEERDRLVIQSIKDIIGDADPTAADKAPIEPWYFYGNPRRLAKSVAQHFLSFWFDCIQFILKGGRREDIPANFGESPWVQMNEMLTMLGLPYSVNSPEDNDLRSPFTLRLYDIRVGEWLNLHQLSSGESAIIRLILFLYSTENYKQKPKLFLLDEPDSHLHASLVHIFINAIQKILIHKFQCQVIMSSHRVETLSYAPESSIFTMNRVVPRIQKAKSQNQAIAILSKNLLTVTRGKCVVFVEDHPDVEFYDGCIQGMQRVSRWPSGIVPKFIASGVSEKGIKGGSGIVATWVGRLRDAGLTNVWGLIDLDDGNKETMSIKVITRYSKENYQYDPVFVSIALIDQGFDMSSKIESEVNIHRAVKFDELSSDVVQMMVNYICHSIEQRNQTILEDEDRKTMTSRRLSGIEITLPIWCATLRGHTLAAATFKTWSLASRKEVEKAFFRHPLLWPNDLRASLLTVVQSDLEVENKEEISGTA